MALTNKQPFRYEQTTDRQVNQLQSNTKTIALVVDNMPWSNGAQIIDQTGGMTTTSIAFTAGQTRTLNHRLGRPAIGFLVIDATGGYPALYRTAQASALDSTTIQLTSQNVCSVSVWVY